MTVLTSNPLSDSDLMALRTAVLDENDWLRNIVEDRVRRAKLDLQASHEWLQAVTALSLSGGDVTDVSAVILKGEEEGIFKTVAQKNAEFELEIITGIETPNSGISSATVEQESLTRQLTAMNSMLTDGTTVTNVTELMDKKLSIMADMVMLGEEKSNLGASFPTESQNRLDATKAGHLFLKAIDTAAASIKSEVANSTITTLDQVKNHPLWPSLV